MFVMVENYIGVQTGIGKLSECNDSNGEEKIVLVYGGCLPHERASAEDEDKRESKREQGTEQLGAQVGLKEENACRGQ